MSDFETYREAADAQRIRTEDWKAGEPLRTLLSSVTGEPTALSVRRVQQGRRQSILGTVGPRDFRDFFLGVSLFYPALPDAIVPAWNMLNSLAASTDPEDVAAFARLATHLPGDGS